MSSYMRRVPCFRLDCRHTIKVSVNAPGLRGGWIIDVCAIRERANKCQEQLELIRRANLKISVAAMPVPPLR